MIKEFSPWDLINPNNPGYIKIYSEYGRNIYNIIEPFLELPGFKKHEVREE